MYKNIGENMQILTVEQYLQHSDIIELLEDCYYDSSYDNVYFKISNYKNNKKFI